MTRCSILLVLAGCSLQTSLNGTSVGPRTTPTSSTASSNSETASAASADHTDDKPRPGYMDCSDRAAYLEKYRESCDSKEPIIVGLTVDDAKKKLTAIGFTGPVEVVEQYEFDASCKADHVCGFAPRRWYVDTHVTFYINRKLAIGAPE